MLNMKILSMVSKPIHKTDRLQPEEFKLLLEMWRSHSIGLQELYVKIISMEKDSNVHKQS